MITFEELFGNLRSTLNQQRVDAEILWNQLSQMNFLDRDRYVSEALVYLRSFLHVLPDIVHTVRHPSILEGAVRILPHPHFALDMSLDSLEDDGVQRLMSSPCVINVKSLNLQRNVVRAEGVDALAGSSYLKHLRRLDLSWNDLGDDEVEVISESPRLSGLTHLDLTWNRIGDRGAISLSRSPHMSNLESLNLSYNKIGQRGSMALRRSPYLTRLESIHARGTNAFMGP